MNDTTGRSPEGPTPAPAQVAVQLLENTVDLVIAYDRTGRVTVWNAIAEHLTGIERNRILGRPLAEFPAIAEWTGGDALHARVLAGESFFLRERPYMVTAYGTAGCFDIYLAPLREHGQIDGGICIVHDITRHVRAEGALRAVTAELRTALADLHESQQTLRAVMDSTHHLVWSVDPESFGLQTFNRSLRDYFANRLGREIVPGMRPEDMLPTPVVEQWRAFYRRAIREGAFSVEYATSAGGLILLLNFHRLEREGVVSGISVFAEDVTEQRRAEASLRQAAEVFENTAEGVMITNPDGVILRVNNAFSEVTGYSEEEARGRKPNILKSGRHDQTFYEMMWGAILASGYWHGEIWNRRKNGEIYPEWLTISAVHDATGATREFVAIFSDLSTVKRSQEQLEFLAHHDPLTKLPNRTLLRARLEHALQKAERNAHSFAVMFLDLDRFKNINDSLGHGPGDLLLQGVSERLRRLVRSEDTVARLGGDEFVLLLESVTPQQAGQKAADALVEVATPFSSEGHEFYVTGSIGIAVFPEDGRDVDTLLRNADAAMYRAKDGGRNTFRFYEPQMTLRAQEHMLLEHALRGALLRSELRVFYQPQVELCSGRMLGVEALVRWQHPELGLVSPERFIPVAEEIGLIAEIDGWVLTESCRQLAQWLREGIPVPRVAVNVSAKELEYPDLLERVRSALAVSGLGPAGLELEMTESTIMHHTEKAIEVIGGLRQLGVALAVDDFGTGYSSLAYLRQLPVHRLKIDQSFVHDVTIDPNDAAIARAVIALGNTLGMEELAEGVETEAQAAFLRREGCAAAQGFFFGRPMPAGELAKWRSPLVAPHSPDAPLPGSR